MGAILREELKIADEKIIKGNIMIARFRGLYYRNDMPDKYPTGYCVELAYRSAPIDAINDEMVLHIGNTFPYHTSLAELYQCWLGFSQAWQSNVINESIHNSTYSFKFYKALSEEKILEAWRAMAIAAHWFLYVKFFARQNIYLDVS